jgi:hypothetical protein
MDPKARPSVTRLGWTIALLLAVMVATSGCPPPRQRDKDQQTGMGPRVEGVVLMSYQKPAREPPSIGNATPVTKDAASEHNQTTA